MSVRGGKEAFLPLPVKELAVENSEEPEPPHGHRSNDHTHAPCLGLQQGSAPLPHLVLCQKKPPKREDLSKTYSLTKCNTTDV